VYLAILALRSGLNETLAILEFWAALIGSLLLMFRDCLSVPSGPTRCPETSTTNQPCLTAQKSEFLKNIALHVHVKNRSLKMVPIEDVETRMTKLNVTKKVERVYRKNLRKRIVSKTTEYG
jgi:hypothetical protein